ncbi:MAG: hypothetical protein U0T33_00055 [Bacteroidales bacterium]
MALYQEKGKEPGACCRLWGWGTDENVFAPLCNDEFDFILFYDYSAEEPLLLQK